MTAHGPTLSRRLADWCARLEWADIPPEQGALLPLRILDTLGLITAGRVSDAGAMSVAFAKSIAGTPQSTLAGAAERLPAAAVALVHGICAHCFDFDDTLVESVVHPGSVVIPTALAVAEACANSDEEFGAAIFAGYETAARVGAVAGRRFHARSLHATGVVGPLAAAVTAGRLLGLTGAQLSSALGLAASMSGGLRAYAVDGGWSKWLHIGWSAHGGIIAAELASRGFRGPEHVLEGGLDLYSVLLHGEGVDRSGLADGLGHEWKSRNAEFKYYPCAHVIQPYIDAVLSLKSEHGLAPDDIRAIECIIAPWAAAIVCEPREAKLRFDSELEAIGSLPYQLAVAAIEGGVDLHALAPETRARADIVAMAHRVVHRTDASLGRSFDGVVHIHTRAGPTYSRDAATAGIDAGKLRRKFIHLVAPVHGHDFATRASDAVIEAARPNWRQARQILAGAGDFDT